MISEQSRKEDYGAEIFVNLQSGSLSTAYKVEKRLAESAFGSVYLVTHKQTGIKRAQKLIKKDQIVDMNHPILTEFNTLKQLDHPNIVQLHEMFQDTKNFYMIMEYLDGGELQDKISQLHSFSEKIIADYMKQIFSAVMHCHAKQIVHRDLKLENILIENKEREDNIKIINFSSSCKIRDGQKLTQKLRDSYYDAPEVLDMNYKEKCDVWSCGIILHILLTGSPPFQNQAALLEKIRSGKQIIDFNSKRWEQVSNDARFLIRKLLTVNAEHRISAQEAYNDLWIQRNAPVTELNPVAIQNLQSFNVKNKLRALIMQYIATQCTANSEKEDLKKAFKQIDKNGDGKLSKDEMVSAYTNYYGEVRARQVVDDVFQKVDTNHSGQVDYTEFIAAAFQEEKLLTKTKLEQTFKIFDINGDGQISSQELTQIMGGQITEQQWKEMLINCDKNYDGQISQQEFIEYMLNKYV